MGAVTCGTAASLALSFLFAFFSVLSPASLGYKSKDRSFSMCGSNFCSEDEQG